MHKMNVLLYQDVHIIVRELYSNFGSSNFLPIWRQRTKSSKFSQESDTKQQTLKVSSKMLWFRISLMTMGGSCWPFPSYNNGSNCLSSFKYETRNPPTETQRVNWQEHQDKLIHSMVISIEIIICLENFLTTSRKCYKWFSSSMRLGHMPEVKLGLEFLKSDFIVWWGISLVSQRSLEHSLRSPLFLGGVRDHCVTNLLILDKSEYYINSVICQVIVYLVDTAP